MIFLSWSRTIRRVYELVKSKVDESVFAATLRYMQDTPHCEDHKTSLEFFGYIGSAGGDLPGEDWRCPVCEINRLKSALVDSETRSAKYRAKLLEIVQIFHGDGHWGEVNRLNKGIAEIDSGKEDA